MSTVGKALSLLDFFPTSGTEMALTDLARLSGFDKATTRRLLLDMAAHGFIEQNPETRGFTIGPAFMRFSRIRETRFPLTRIAQQIARGLCDELSETVHVTESAGGKLTSILAEEPARSTRVSLEPGQTLPLHSTASGMAFLAASSNKELDALLAQPLTAITSQTVTDAVRLRTIIEDTRKRGFSISMNGNEEGVVSVAAAFLAPTGKPVGTITIAAPATRMSADALLAAGPRVVQAAQAIAQALYGSHTKTRKEA